MNSRIIDMQVWKFLCGALPTRRCGWGRPVYWWSGPDESTWW